MTEGEADQVGALTIAAAARGLPLTVLAPSDARLPQRYEARLALVRPDQHVAWRGEALPADLEGLLDRVTGLATGASPAAALPAAAAA